MGLRILKQGLSGLLTSLVLSTPVLAQLATAPAEMARTAQEYRLDGAVEAVHQSTLSAQTSGQVQEVLVDVDDYVEQGSLIIRLKDAEQQARYSQAQANLQAAVAQLQDAQKEYQRTKDIYARKLVAKAAMDKATAGLKTAEAQRKSAQAALKQAEEQLEYTRIRAPFTGIVTERLIEAGETAQPGRPLISGLSLEKLRVNVDVPQSLIAGVRKHAKARVRLPDGQWLDTDGLTVFPYAEPVSNTFKVRVDLSEGVEGVFPGMTLKVAFVAGEHDQLSVPRSAVVHRSEVTAVYVVQPDGSISLRHVRLGDRLNDRQVILAGLHEGEQVALDPVAAGVALKRQRGE
jgi:RND family efflux transporter MFP subunit